MPISISLPEYLMLLSGGDDSLFAARGWILRNTDALGWGCVIPAAQARQVLALDPKEECSHIETYEDDNGDKIFVCFSRQAWFECQERQRLIKLRASLIHREFNKKNECLELAAFAAQKLKDASFGGLDWKQIFFARVELLDYSTPRFAQWLGHFNATVVPQFKLFPADFTMPPNTTN